MVKRIACILLIAACIAGILSLKGGAVMAFTDYYKAISGLLGAAGRDPVTTLLKSPVTPTTTTPSTTYVDPAFKPQGAAAQQPTTTTQPRITQPVTQTTGGGGGGGGGGQPAPQQPTGDQGGEQFPSPFIYEMPTYEAPTIPTYSLQEMMDIIGRKLDLMVTPQLEQLQRTLEEEQLGGAQQRTQVQADYAQAIADLEKMGQGYQRAGAETMRRRGVYESGMAVGLANQIQREVVQAGGKIEQEQAKVLADLGEYLALRERHTNEQIQSLMGQKAQWAESLLEEMRMKERDRTDRLEQQAFENWLSQSAQQFQISQANWNAAFQQQQAGWQQQFATQQDAWQRAIQQQQLGLQQSSSALQQQNQQLQQQALAELRRNGWAGLSPWAQYLLLGQPYSGAHRQVSTPGGWGA